MQERVTGEKGKVALQKAAAKKKKKKEERRQSPI